MPNFRVAWALAAYLAIFSLPRGVSSLRHRTDDGTPVPLGSAIGYTILAQTAISSYGSENCVITGDIGISPGFSTAITGFNLQPAATAPSTLEFSTSAQVVGMVYAADYTGGTDTTPGELTTATTDVSSAYTDANNETPVDYSEVGGGQLGGDTLLAGIYSFSTPVNIGSDVTLYGDCKDTFVFQIAGPLTQAAGTSVTLSGGVLASNVFWAVAGPVTIGVANSGANFQGIILGASYITLNKGSTVTGRLYASTYVAMTSATVTPPAASGPCSPQASVTALCFGCPAADAFADGLTSGPSAAGGGDFLCDYSPNGVCYYNSLSGYFDATPSSNNCITGQAPTVPCPMRKRKKGLPLRSYRRRPADVRIPSMMRERAKLGKYKGSGRSGLNARGL